MKKVLFFLFSSLFVVGCMTTQYVAPNAQINSKPDFEDYVPMYLWGFGREHSPVDPKAVCQDKNVLKVRKGKTFEDGLLSFFTLGIYWPNTVQVWCQPQS